MALDQYYFTPLVSELQGILAAPEASKRLLEDGGCPLFAKGYFLRNRYTTAEYALELDYEFSFQCENVLLS